MDRRDVTPHPGQIDVLLDRAKALCQIRENVHCWSPDHRLIPPGRLTIKMLVGCLQA
jgi:hypothetical protein